MFQSPKLWPFLVFYLLIGINADSAVNSIRDIKWIIAKHGESHVDTCQRAGFTPLFDQLINIAWNTSILSDIVNEELNLDSLGIIGCCGSGLWCRDDGTCFTQGFGGKFQNIGWLSSIDNLQSNPVFSCQNGNLTINPASKKEIELTSIEYNKVSISSTISNNYVEKATIALFSLEEKFIRPQQCNEIVCRSCNVKNPCPVGFVCLDVGGMPSCFQYCSYGIDNSCPCQTFCDHVSIYAMKSKQIISLDLCTPISFNSKTNGRTCESFNSGIGIFEAHIPRLSLSGSISSNNSQQQNGIPGTVSIELAEMNHPNFVKEYSISLGSKTFLCRNDQDCYDKSICTRDRCIESRCQFEPMIGCDSILDEIKLQQVVLTYLAIVEKNVAKQHLDFSNLLTSNTQPYNFEKSSFKLLHLPFSFNFFGNLVGSLMMNFNGLVQLPPIFPCTGPIGSIECVAYSSASNSIVLATSNGDAGFPYSPLLHVDIQSMGGDICRQYDNIDANAVHLSYSFPKSDAPFYGNNEISSSIYNDGSIKIRYHVIDTVPSDGTTTVLWGSKVTQDQEEGAIYNFENLPAIDVASHNSITYCPINKIACIVESCAIANSSIEVLWNGPICQALRPDLHLSIRCVWNGGLAVTIPLSNAPSSLKFSNSIICPVPFMSNTSNNAILSLAIEVAAGDTDSMTDFTSTETQTSRKIIGVYRDQETLELARANLMVRYFLDNSSHHTCGCNPLKLTSRYQCDNALVCGGFDDTFDCAGTPFGSAYLDYCGVCVGGYTGAVPSQSCNSLWHRIDIDYNMYLLKQLIYFLALSSVLFLVFSKCWRNVKLAIRRHLGLITSNGIDNFPSDISGFESSHTLERRHHQLGQLRNGSIATSIPSTIRLPSVGLTQSELNTIGISIESSPFTNECPICLLSVNSGDHCRILPEPCGHVFHMVCIDEWFQQSQTCPLCKRSIRDIIAEGSLSTPRVLIAHSWSDSFRNMIDQVPFFGRPRSSYFQLDNESTHSAISNNIELSTSISTRIV